MVRHCIDQSYYFILDMADNKGGQQSSKKPTDSQKKLQESQAQVDEVSTLLCTWHANYCDILYISISSQ